MLKIFINGREFGLILRIRRITQKELAQKTGLSEVHISRLINQQAPVGLIAQRKIQSIIKGIAFERMFTTMDTL